MFRKIDVFYDVIIYAFLADFFVFLLSDDSLYEI